MSKKSRARAAVAPNANARASIAKVVLERYSLPFIKTADVPKPVIPIVAPDWPAHWPACPKTCDPLEWRKSLENKEYYEAQAKRGDGKAWFQYPKQPTQYSEFVYCTPEMAQQLLEHMPVNRPWKENWSDTISRDILCERWLQTHESIGINKLLDMYDGQHRAQGIIKAGRGWPIYITWNVPAEAIYVTDSGDKRKVNEKLALLFPESKLNHKTAALCRAMMWGLDGRGVRLSESEIAQFAVKYPVLVNWVAGNMRTFRADIQAVVGKALLWWGEQVVGPFVTRLKTVEFHGEGDPARALYLWIGKTRQQNRRTSYAGPMIYYRKTLSAVLAHCQNRDANRLLQKTDDIFEWEPDWEVPDEYKGQKRPLQGPIFGPEQLTPQTEE